MNNIAPHLDCRSKLNDGNWKSNPFEVIVPYMVSPAPSDLFTFWWLPSYSNSLTQAFVELSVDRAAHIPLTNLFSSSVLIFPEFDAMLVPLSLQRGLVVGRQWSSLSHGIQRWWVYGQTPVVRGGYNVHSECMCLDIKRGRTTQEFFSFQTDHNSQYLGRTCKLDQIE